MRGTTELRFVAALIASIAVSGPALAGGPICGNGTLQTGEECDDGNTAAADGCSATCTIEGPLDKTEQACVNGVNAGFASVVLYTDKSIGACLAAVASGKFAGTFETCLGAVSFDKVGGKVIATNAKKCTDKGVTAQTAFGHNGDAVAVIMQAAFAARDAHVAVLGSPAAVALTATDKDAAKCQQAVTAGLSRYLDALAKETNKRKKASLKDKAAPALSSVELAADLVPAGGSAAAAKALEAAKSKAAKKCEGVSLAALFPGAACADETASASTLLDCGTAVASCELCQALNAADRLAIDCSQYSPSPLCDPATPEDCGNGVEQLGEECDDGNTAPGDGCRADCTDEICGDGTTDPQEECDDGNTVSDDGCRADCTDEECGDAITDVDEECDDGNTAEGDGCRNDCTEELCGDGILDPQEECDAGDTVNGDGCDSNCQEEFDCAGEGGVAVEGACWFLAAADQSCQTACDGEGLAYDPATETVAGSGGTNAACGNVMTNLGFPNPGPQELACATGLGCWVDLAIPPVPIGTASRCTSPATDAASAPTNMDRRACACEPIE